MARLGPSGASVSDIDFVAVTSRPLATAAIRALHRVHRRLAAAPLRPVMDGIYLTWGDLAQDLVKFGGVRTATVVGSPRAQW